MGRRSADEYAQATMTSNAAVLCLLLLSAGQLAAASKSFGGGGGYGEEAGGNQEVPDVLPALPQLPLLTPAAKPVDNNYKGWEKAWSYSFGPGVQDGSPAATPYGGPEDESARPATPSKSSSTTPSTGGDDEASSSIITSPASSPTKNKGYSSGGAPPSSSTTPATTPSKSSSSPSISYTPSPSTGGVKKASGAAGGASSSSTKGKSTMTPVSTGSGKAADSASVSRGTTPASSGNGGKASYSASGGSGGGQHQGGSSTPTPTPTPTPSYGLDPAGEPEYGLNQKAIDDILREHNAFRAKEHVPPLAWNATLARFSQRYAEETLRGPCKMVHSTSPYGENLMQATGGGGGVTWKATVDQWSDEKRSYHYGSNSCDAGKMCGHYTAVVWKGTTSVGCGRVKCDNGDTMIMCSYWPPGNYDGARPY